MRLNYRKRIHNSTIIVGVSSNNQEAGIQNPNFPPSATHGHSPHSLGIPFRHNSIRQACRRKTLPARSFFPPSPLLFTRQLTFSTAERSPTVRTLFCRSIAPMVKMMYGCFGRKRGTRRPVNGTEALRLAPSCQDIVYHFLGCFISRKGVP